MNVFRSAFSLLPLLVSASWAADEEPLTSLAMKFHALVNESVAGIPADYREFWKRKGVQDAIAEKRFLDAANELDAVLRHYPAQLGTFPAYRVLTDAYLGAGKTDLADGASRRALRAIDEIVQSYLSRPEIVLMVQAYERTYARLAAATTEDYERGTAFFTGVRMQAIFAEFIDFILSEHCQFEISNGHYPEALDLTKAMDNWYQSRPEPERDRMVPDRLRARILWAQGNKEDAAAIMEATAQRFMRLDPYEEVSREAQRMRDEVDGAKANGCAPASAPAQTPLKTGASCCSQNPPKAAAADTVCCGGIGSNSCEANCGGCATAAQPGQSQGSSAKSDGEPPRTTKRE